MMIIGKISLKIIKKSPKKTQKDPKRPNLSLNLRVLVTFNQNHVFESRQAKESINDGHYQKK
jgi:hypothetical protein